MTDKRHQSEDWKDEITNLVTALEMGHATEADVRRLDELLSGADGAARTYLEHVRDSVDLGFATEEPRDETPPSVSLKPEPQSLHSRDKGPVPSKRVIGWLAACAACIAITAVLVRQPNSQQQIVEQPRTSIRELSDTEYVATLTGTVDCDWASHLKAPEYGEPLEAGRVIQLNSGVAQLTFDDGAKVVLQGPARFTVETTGSAELTDGKLAALVPRQAVGFRIVTPTAEIVDLGTEFGLDVADDGETEVHVFTGEVVVWKRGDNETEREGHRLEEDQAAKVDSVSGVQDSLKSDASKFRREITPRLSKAELPPLEVNDDLALWLAADVMVKTDDSNGVIAWRDIATGDNQTEEDAWQHDVNHRPTWVPNAIAGLPAIRFDGESSYLTTTPMVSTESQTLFLVFSRDDVPFVQGNMRQIINYNGPPYSLSPFDGTPMRVLQIDDSRKSGKYWARFYAGGVGNVYNVGSVSTKGEVPADEPTLLSYRYDADSNASAISIDGEIQNTDNAPRWKRYTSRKVLGRHPKDAQNCSFFAGDIAEVLIYNAALDDEQMKSVTKYLVEKYSLK